ncbi:hypothetical protein H6G97_47570 [Nostoc flagelliforme FACHB-838]|uniref:Uncharacterized protein n=1 Tax=Nostoc flagelliforme FACHB-838 TaxID=2692904 RepID=A0ABR8E4T5_9NOSO|nr:hypothetical protein [Nostoc flagelliforme]MBD2536530.1 hypothetical protein [Nostoc flagelliforme FACHB-838]
MIAVELGLISKLIAQSEASGAADFGSRQFTNHQISFAHAKIERWQLVLAGVSLYIGFVYINFYISSGRMAWLPAPPCTKSARLLMVDSSRR